MKKIKYPFLPIKCWLCLKKTPRYLMEKWLKKVHLGDNIKLMYKMPAGSIDLVVTSPPYNLRNNTGNGMKNGSGGKWANVALLNGYKTTNDNIPHDEYIEWQKESLRAMMRLLSEDGTIFYNHKWRVQGGLLQDRQDIVGEFPIRQIIIWQRNGGINFNPGYFLPTYEVIYLICKPDFKLAPRPTRREMYGAFHRKAITCTPTLFLWSWLGNVFSPPMPKMC